MRITESKLWRIIREELDEAHDHDISRMLDMDPWTFDQAQEGWRSLPRELQIDAIKAYISGPLEGWLIKPSRSGKHVGRSTIIWHLGQALAIRGGPGDGVGAVGWMKRCKDPEDSQWNNYVDATIAFLESDRAAFEENAMGENDNSSTLERLRVGWGKSYGEVY